MKVAKQLLKEFALPCVVALSWTLYSMSGGQFSLIAAVTVFGPAFFLASWLVGQVFRVRKQVGVEKSFGDVEGRLIKLTGSLSEVEGRLERLAETLESNVKEMVGHINGGDSFCYAMPIGVASGKRQWLLRHCGGFPLYKVSARFTDIGDLAKGIEDTFSWDEISVGGNSMVTSLPALKDEQAINIFFYSRNGRVVQEIRFGMLGDHSAYAYRLSRGYETLIQYLPKGFELREEDRRDWLPEFGFSGTCKEWSIEYSAQKVMQERAAK